MKQRVETLEREDPATALREEVDAAIGALHAVVGRAQAQTIIKAAYKRARKQTKTSTLAALAKLLSDLRWLPVEMRSAAGPVRAARRGADAAARARDAPLRVPAHGRFNTIAAGAAVAPAAPLPAVAVPAVGEDLDEGEATEAVAEGGGGSHAYATRDPGEI